MHRTRYRTRPCRRPRFQFFDVMAGLVPAIHASAFSNPADRFKSDIVSNVIPFVLCVDIGGPAKIGWADLTGRDGTGANLGDALDRLSQSLREEKPAALGFEAPIWTPVRAELARITGRRGGIETTYNRAWSAGAGWRALGAALSMMTWCLRRIAKTAGPVATTVDSKRFQERGGLFLWEAFVSGSMKRDGTSHHDDARAACLAFAARWPHFVSDIPAEPAMNHAVSPAMAAGLSVDPLELAFPALVIETGFRWPGQARP